MTELKKKILITGAAGRIGRYLAENLGEHYSLILADIREPQKPTQHRFVTCDVTDLESMRLICQEIDTVVHLAANPSPAASWEELYLPNIVGVNNVFQAAHEAGCRRVVFASSGHAVYGYPADAQVRPDMQVRPLNLYGVSKVWGETIGRYYADQKGLSCICLRIGWVVERHQKRLLPESPLLNIVLTYQDAAQLFSLSIDAPDDLKFGIFNGVSNNRWNRLDISQARAVLGYEPQDDGFALAEYNAGQG